MLVSPETMAERWGCHPANVRAFLRAGGMPHILLGRRMLRVRREVFEEFDVTPDVREVLDRPIPPPKPSLSGLAAAMREAVQGNAQSGKSYIYFIRCGEFVKVGRSNRPIQRLRDLQSSNPMKLEMLKYVRGTVAGEKAVQTLLKPYHVHFEWFHAAPDLLAAVDLLPGRPSKRVQRSEQL